MGHNSWDDQIVVLVGSGRKTWHRWGFIWNTFFYISLPWRALWQWFFGTGEVETLLCSILIGDQIHSNRFGNIFRFTVNIEAFYISNEWVSSPPGSPPKSNDAVLRWGRVSLNSERPPWPVCQQHKWWMARDRHQIPVHLLLMTTQLSIWLNKSGQEKSSREKLFKWLCVWLIHFMWSWLRLRIWWTARAE